MKIAKKTVVTSGWIMLSAMTFAIGWYLKPAIRVVETLSGEGLSTLPGTSLLHGAPRGSAEGGDIAKPNEASTGRRKFV